MMVELMAYWKELKLVDSKAVLMDAMKVELMAV